MVSWNIFKIKLPTGYGPGTGLLHVIRQMIRQAAQELSIETCITTTVAAKDFSDNTVLTYPMEVYDINSVLLGTVANTAEYIALWNANNANRSRGFIVSGTGSSFVVRPVYINITPPLYGVSI